MNFRYYNVQLLVPVIIGTLLLIDIIFQGLGLLINELGATFNFNSGYIVLIRTPTNGALVLVLLKWYDRKLWKIKGLNRLVNVPNMNGRYTGKLESSFQTEGKNTLLSCVLEITQTASTINAKMFIDNPNNLKKTKSDSSLESIETTNDKNFFRLSFTHTNSGQLDKYGLKSHKGSTSLIYNAQNYSLNGEYYNEPQKATCGKIDVEFESINRKNKI